MAAAGAVEAADKMVEAPVAVEWAMGAEGGATPGAPQGAVVGRSGHSEKPGHQELRIPR